MDLMTLGLGLGIVGAAAFIDVRGLDWAQKIVSERLQKEAMSRRLIKEFPTSAYDVTLDDDERKAA